MLKSGILILTTLFLSSTLFFSGCSRINETLDKLEKMQIPTILTPKPQPDTSGAYLIRPTMSQDEINQILATNKKVQFEDGTYNIDATIGLKLSSDQTVILGDKVIIKAIPNDKGNYEIIKLNNIRNTIISGGNIVGERNSHKGKTGEWGMGVNLYECTNVRIENMKITDCWGDGIYLGASEKGYNKDILITGCVFDNNRRQGISIISAENLTIENTKITNTNGTPPACGIDFEPNYSTQKMEKIKVNNVYTYNNEAAGICLSTFAIPYIDITINSHKHDGGEIAQPGLDIRFPAKNGLQSGRLKVINPIYVNTNNKPIVYNAKIPKTFSVSIKNLKTDQSD